MVKIAAVVDSACLIGLERIGRLELLSALIDLDSIAISDASRAPSGRKSLS
jgi:hypothetical protein